MLESHGNMQWSFAKSRYGAGALARLAFVKEASPWGAGKLGEEQYKAQGESLRSERGAQHTARRKGEEASQPQERGR